MAANALLHQIPFAGPLCSGQSPRTNHCTNFRRLSTFLPSSLPVDLPPTCRPSTGNSVTSRRAARCTGRLPRRALVLGAPLLLLTAERCTGNVTAMAAVSADGPISKSDTVFVIGATGATGSRIVKQLLAQGVKVKAGVRNLQKAKAAFGTLPNLDVVYADVTEGVDALAASFKGAAAVVVASGFTPSFDLTAAWKVDNLGTVAVVDAAKRAGARKVVMVSSLLTNGAAAGQIFNQSYVILNLFGLVLIAKLQAENYLRASGLDYTIVRPGGLSNSTPAEVGSVVMQKEDTLFEGRVSRDQVAAVAVEALFSPSASRKVVEIVARPDAKASPLEDLFASV